MSIFEKILEFYRNETYKIGFQRGSLKRMPYFLARLVLVLLSGISLVVVLALFDGNEFAYHRWASITISILIAIPYLYLLTRYFAIMFMRLRDIGWPWWIFVIGFIPYVGPLFGGVVVLWPTNEEKNPPTGESKWALFWQHVFGVYKIK